MNDRKALLKFVKYIANAPEGTRLEVGIMYDAEKGWRVYERIGEKALAMEPAQARKMGEFFRKKGESPEWRAAWEDLKNTLGELTALADEADQNNRNKVIPPGYADMMPTRGNA